MFLRRTYLEKPGPNSQCVESATLRYDVSGLMRCYDTAAGVGILGRDADRKKTKKGWPTWAAAIPILALGAALYYLPEIGSWALTRATGRNAAAEDPANQAPKPQKQTLPFLPEAPDQAVAAATVGPAVNKKPTEKQENNWTEEDDVSTLFVVGHYTDASGAGWAWLSNGRSVRLRAPKVTHLLDDGAIVMEGRLIPVQPKTVAPSASNGSSHVPQQGQAGFQPIANPNAKAYSRTIRLRGFDGSVSAVRQTLSPQGSDSLSPSRPTGEVVAYETLGGNEGPPETLGAFVPASNYQ